MDFSEIKNIVLQSSEIQMALEAMDREPMIVLKGLNGSLKSIFLALLFEQKKASICLVTADEEQGEALREDLELLLGIPQVAYIPRISEIAQSDIVIDSIRKGQLLTSLERLVEGRKQVILVSAKNISLRYPAPEWIEQQRLVIAAGQTYDFEHLKARLAGLGFNREAMVENGGEMSFRGGIVDVFPFSSDYPYRIEFFGDTIESIRIFDPTTQRSIERVAQVAIYPQYPEQPDAAVPDWGKSLFDYLAPDTVLFLDEPALIQKEVEEFLQFVPPTDEAASTRRYLHWDELVSCFGRFRAIFHNPMLERLPCSIFDIGSQAQEPLRGHFSLLKKKVDYFCSTPSKSADQTWRLYFCCDHKDQVERFEELLAEARIDCQSVAVRDWGFNQGFVFAAVGLVLFTDNQFYGRPIRWRKRKRRGPGLTPQQLQALKIGDYVVHEDHGIGQYRGFKKITVRGSERECLSIAYQDNDFLYVPLERMDRVQKYAAKEGIVPTLSKLGSKDWDRLKKKTKKHVKEMARELIRLYAQRKAQKGFAFSRDSLWQKELEASFEYEDTPDQRRVTEEVKQDMESESPMDRLVCGDVGFGKTEIAIRAAFKAVNDNKQVAMLVPTTILALQHYNLFRERLKNYPIKIELLSRFRGPAEQKLVVQWLKEGRVDIVIGTHRLLSNDVQFAKLGLLVIDEEHRFGVKNKERLKQKYVNVDVLSMSATPIPRTLNMGLLGIRDLSLIATPPRERLPIYTEVAPFSKELIRMAILKEVQRGGQVFFVHNRVESIETVADMLRRLVPEVSFVVAHGQMDEGVLEKVMWDFAMGRYQCLVSTMIIGSGLDLPRVNTLIVNRADRFGLSQLYQLRGRVGRSNQLAYAYLLVPPLHLLTKTALQRLRIIEEFTELGAGFNIAMRDLEIRGAGNIFGAEQSGHIIALGYELYSKIIGEAIAELKRENSTAPAADSVQPEETRVEIDQHAFIPDSYIDQPEIKVDIYRRLAMEKELLPIRELREEVRDRFGMLPAPVSNLFNLVELKIIGGLLDFKSIKLNGRRLTAFFSDNIARTSDRELIQKKVCVITEKLKGQFYFIQDQVEGFGIKIEIPNNEGDVLEYCKNSLAVLI